MAFAVARTRDEAHLYFDLHPCECGSADTTWRNGLVDVEGELVNRYFGECEECGTPREFLFGLPERPVLPDGFPTFGGAEPSELLDAGEWLWVADLTAGDVPVHDRAEALRALRIAAAAVEEVVKFVPAGADAVPGDGFWSERGQGMHATETGRFQLDRLLVVRDTYQRLAADYA
ncbi:hypothetical protein ACFFV7_35465 [Nonomuraea spiralis]|uniref:Uncharacterized protein n=1 Tax=Nonomuraea spiralis TaxID=46182 RepID=A0ABV5IPT5_9ACTN|nr:hypothetical protein [Nonomuraea spiralis]GGT32171.1 hypothetical protein GCM10010176_091000 [Nonomuraea spiralis]